MEHKYKERTLTRTLKEASRQFPAIILTGPRQSGKTTLVRHVFGSTHSYVSLDDPAIRDQAVSDPKLLLDRFRAPLILDEIQYAPDLLSYLKLEIDNHRDEKGRYIITGSQNFALMQGVTESLAGRAAVLSLFSMSLREAEGNPEGEKGWREILRPGEKGGGKKGSLKVETLSGHIFRGGFPEPALDPGINPRLWHSAYMQTYLERDVRSLRAVGDLSDFQRLIFLLAARTGSLINFSDLARDLAVSMKTIQAWVSVLEAGGQIYVLKPYHANLGKRLVKQPKIYFLDTGTLCYLLGLEEPGQVFKGVTGGALFEAAVFGELFRLFVQRGEMPRIYFFRTAAGLEVDFVIEDGDRLIPVEAKLTATPGARQTGAIEKFQKLLGARGGSGLVVCLDADRHPLTRTVDTVPLGAF